MATIQEKQAESMAVLKEYQDAYGENLVIHSADTLGRTHTERLVDSGYLKMVIKGWYIPYYPGSEGDSTVWYVSYWYFIVEYLNSKFGDNWCLSPELSLYFYSGKSVVPQKLIVRSDAAANNILQLPFGTSLLDIKASLPPSAAIETAGLHPVAQDAESILSMMDATYIKDSYNSLSIEGYKITEGLLEKVRSGNWDPKNDEEDKERKNALAARGYYQAYQLLKQSVAAALVGQDPAQMYVKSHQSWHFQLFEPCIRAGIIKASDLVGYRTYQVYIRNSMHVPLNPDAVLDAMTALSTLMQEEPDAFVRAVLGHFFFVYIHPYMDGNGRTARFTMNSQLVTGGYPWIVVPMERRDEYMASLEKASVEEEIEPFVRFIVSLIA